MERGISQGSDHRERVATYLTLLASDAAREMLGRYIDRDRLAFELCRIWFDDIYVPSRRYFDTLKGDFSEEAVERFNAAFRDDERAGLERFSRFLELRMEMLSSAARSLRRMPNNDAWQGLVRHAVYMLDDLEPDAEYRKARLADAVAGMDSSEAVDFERLLAAALKPIGGSDPEK